MTNPPSLAKLESKIQEAVALKLASKKATLKYCYQDVMDTIDADYSLLSVWETAVKAGLEFSSLDTFKVTWYRIKKERDAQNSGS